MELLTWLSGGRVWWSYLPGCQEVAVVELLTWLSGGSCGGATDLVVRR